MNLFERLDHLSDKHLAKTLAQKLQTSVAPEEILLHLGRSEIIRLIVECNTQKK